MIKLLRLIPFLVMIVLLIQLGYQCIYGDVAITAKKTVGYILSVFATISLILDFEWGLVIIALIFFLGSLGFFSITRNFTTHSIGINGHEFFLKWQPLFVELLVFHLILNYAKIRMKICSLFNSHN